MSGRTSSTNTNHPPDEDTIRSSIGLNTAMIQCESMEQWESSESSPDIHHEVKIIKSVSTTIPTKNSLYNRRSLKKKTVTKVESSIPRLTTSEKKSEPNREPTTSTTVTRTDLKAKSLKITSDKIIRDGDRTRLCEKKKLNTECHDKSKLSIHKSNNNDDSELTDNSWSTLDQLSVSRLNDSNIWPALSAIEKTLNDNNENRHNRESVEILEILNEKFIESPRSFTENLLTILEESVTCNNQSCDVINDIIDERKKINYNENQNNPKIIISENNKQSISGSSNSEIIDDSNKYVSHLSLSNRGKCVELNNINDEITNNINNPRDKSPANSDYRCYKNYSKSPKIVKLNTPKIGMSQRLRIGSGSSNQISPRDINKLKTPKIVIDCPSPENLKNLEEKLLKTRKNSKDDEYLTAESDTDESQESTLHQLSEDPVASSTQKFDMSRLASCREEWVNTYKQITKLNSRDLPESWKKKLQQKREKCFNVVERLMAKDVEVVPAKKIVPDDSSNEYKLTKEFLNTLRACSDYMTLCGSILTDAGKKTHKYLTAINLANERIRLCSSPRRTPIKSPTLLAKRRSVSKLFSPTLHNTAGSSKSSVCSSPRRTPIKSPTLLAKRRSVSKLFSPMLHNTAGSSKSSVCSSPRRTPIKSPTLLAKRRSVSKLFSPMLHNTAGSSKSSVCSSPRRTPIKSPTLLAKRRSVSKLFSPMLHNTAGSSKSSGNEIPRTSKESELELATFKSLTSQKFKLVKSPVAQYIRGKK